MPTKTAGLGAIWDPSKNPDALLGITGEWPAEQLRIREAEFAPENFL
ncbi:hypothetical protein [Nocardia sp. NBC_01388]